MDTNELITESAKLATLIHRRCNGHQESMELALNSILTLTRRSLAFLLQADQDRAAMGRYTKPDRHEAQIAKAEALWSKLS